MFTSVALLAIVATASVTSLVMEQSTPKTACRSLTGIWEVTRPMQNHSDYYRLTQEGDTLLLETHSPHEFAFGRPIESDEYETVIKTDKLELLKNIREAKDDCSLVLKDGSVWHRVQDIKKVNVIYMNHLDVGYNVNHMYPGTKIFIPGYVLNVLNWYFQVYFPRAARLADELRALRARESFIYTTHPWLVNLFLDCPTDWELSGVKLQCPSEEQVETFRRAVWMGDISWHAGPLNQEAESSNPELFSYSLTLSEKLDELFDIKRDSRTLSQRDVPGMTRAAIPYMLARNIQAISFGVNGGSAPPDVPSPNVWKFGEHEIITYWHKGGYPLKPGPSPQDPGGLSRNDCQFVEGLDEVLCFIFRSDNLGPPENIKEIKTDWKIIRYQFPGSDIKACKFEDFTRLLIPLKHTFPVVDAEIGDTWIQGPASDPVKMIKYRTINRLRSQCLRLKQCDVSDKRFDYFSRILVKLPEHTYGLGACFDDTNWSNEEFEPMQYLKESFRNNTMNYLGHRAFNDMAVKALKDHPLAKQIEKEFETLKPYLPALDGYTASPLNATISCKNGIRFRVGSHGGLVRLQDPKGNDWASDESPIAKILYRTYSEKDYNITASQYRYARGGAFWKTNYQNAKPESKFWDVEAHGVYVPTHGDPCEQGVYVRVIHPDMNTWWKYGAPTEYFLRYQTTNNGLEIEYQFFNKLSTRMVEALFLSFETPLKVDHRWYLHKVGYLIDPTNIVNNGSQYVHAVDFGVGYLDSKQRGLLIESPDAATVSVLTSDRPADVLPVPLTPMTSSPNGMAFNFYNNVWETNFIFWYPFEPQDKHYKARFRVTFA